MPRGFDVETGSELSDKLIVAAEQLKKFFECALPDKLQEGTFVRPITGSELILKFNLIFQTKLVGPDIRAMVNYLRRNRVPIGSCSDGYFYATRPEQLRETKNHLHDRIAGMQAALAGLELAFEGKPEQYQLI